ncbi:MAG: hypothetical protein K2W78_00270 [Xanthobacteraceae bacterium]|nr:hypothetical protein [Xanthobacteraceae bacterium]
MTEDDLKTVLCRLEPGMSLTLPDEWVDRNFRGTPAIRVGELREIALQLGCALHHGIGNSRIEKLDYPRTG